MKAPDKVYIDDLAVVNDCATKISLKQLPHFSEYIRKGTVYKMINKQLRELWCASSSQADNDEYYKNPLVKQLKGLINEIESL